MSHPSPKRSIKLQSDVPLALPSQEAEQRLALRRVDWRRIRRLVAEMADPSPAAAVWPSTFLGVAITAGLSLIPLAQATPEPETWVIPTFVVVTLAALALAAYAQWAWRRMATQRRNDVTSICADMDEIESAYEAEAGREAESRAEAGRSGNDSRLPPRMKEVLDLMVGRPVTAKEVSERLAIPMATTAGILSRLNTLGYIEQKGQEAGRSRWGPAEARRDEEKPPATPSSR